MNDKISAIKNWLGTGSINIFGLPMSGKDTQGIRLAGTLDAKFLSSGLIIRAKEKELGKDYSEHGSLIPTNVFYEWVLPYFERQDLYDYPLILSSIGRWSGEETTVMTTAASAGHEIKAVIFLDIPEDAVKQRFEMAKTLNDRGDRKDDTDPATFQTRLEEFGIKTQPVIQKYRELDLLIEVDGNQDRNSVFNEIIEKLYQRAVESHS